MHGGCTQSVSGPLHNVLILLGIYLVTKLMSKPCLKIVYWIYFSTVWELDMGIPTPTASKATQWKIKDQYGTIAVYTRSHINGCTLTDPNENHCSCPKWFYVNRRGEKTRQYAANTPSFAEACAKAKHEHDGWHPEIAAARVEKTKQERAKTPVKVAVPKFIAGKCADGILDGTRDLYRCYLGHVDEKTGKERGYLFLW